MSPEIWERLGIQLHHVLAECLLDRLKGEAPTAEVLAVARRYLRTLGIAPATETARDRKALQRISKLYVRGLLDSLEDGSASGAVLAEAGAFLRATGALDGLQGRAQAARAVRDMADLDLPFSD